MNESYKKKVSVNATPDQSQGSLENNTQGSFNGFDQLLEQRMNDQTWKERSRTIVKPRLVDEGDNGFDPNNLLNEDANGNGSHSSTGLSKSQRHSTKIDVKISRSQSEALKINDDLQRPNATKDRKSKETNKNGPDPDVIVEEEGENGSNNSKAPSEFDEFEEEVATSRMTQANKIVSQFANWNVKVFKDVTKTVTEKGKTLLTFGEKELGFEEMLDKIFSETTILNQEERMDLEDLIIYGIPDHVRGKFWVACAGVQAYKSGYCDNYYDTICMAEEYGMWNEYPNNHFKVIAKDMPRTFMNDPFYTEDIKKSIERVLRAYVWRNPTVGYIQGLNFLVFRLRKYLDEEDTFWVFVLIVETYMTPDYYVDMYGATTQANILTRIFRQYNILPEVTAKFEELNISLITFSVNWFISIFTAALPEESSFAVLDLFLLKGQTNSKIIFDVSLAILRILEKQIVACDDMSDFYTKIFVSSNEALKDSQLLLQEILSPKNQLKQAHIDFYRPVCQKEEVDKVQLDMDKKFKKLKEKRKNADKEQRETINRKIFLEQFKMFTGRIQDQLKESVEDPLNFFKCNQKWPMCAFNFAKPHMIPDQFVFRAENPNDFEIQEDYFCMRKLAFKEKKSRQRDDATGTKNILIERNYHYCKINAFTKQLSQLYVSPSKQEKLFMCKYYDIKKKMTLLETHKKMLKFCAYVKAQKVPQEEQVLVKKILKTNNLARADNDGFGAIAYLDSIRGRDDATPFNPRQSMQLDSQDDDQIYGEDSQEPRARSSLPLRKGAAGREAPFRHHESNGEDVEVDEDKEQKLNYFDFKQHKKSKSEVNKVVQNQQKTVIKEEAVEPVPVQKKEIRPADVIRTQKTVVQEEKKTLVEIDELSGEDEEEDEEDVEDDEDVESGVNTLDSWSSSGSIEKEKSTTGGEGDKDSDSDNSNYDLFGVDEFIFGKRSKSSDALFATKHMKKRLESSKVELQRVKQRIVQKVGDYEEEDPFAQKFQVVEQTGSFLRRQTTVVDLHKKLKKKTKVIKVKKEASRRSSFALGGEYLRSSFALGGDYSRSQTEVPDASDMDMGFNQDYTPQAKLTANVKSQNDNLAQVPEEIIKINSDHRRSRMNIDLQDQLLNAFRKSYDPLRSKHDQVQELMQSELAKQMDIFKQ